MLDIVSYGIGTIVGLTLVAFLLLWVVRDIVQKKHAVLRNYPVIGHLRYFFEKQGDFIRQYLIAGERDEMPFDRVSRNWIYRTAKGIGGVVGFGSTNDLRDPGAIIFVNATFPVLDDDLLVSPGLMIGEEYCRAPFVARSLVNISGMSYGALSAPAVKALSRGAELAGCRLDIGEGGLSPNHLAGECDRIQSGRSSGDHCVGAVR